MAHFPLLLRLLFLSVQYIATAKNTFADKEKIPGYFEGKNLDCVRLMIAKNCVYIRKQ